MPAHRLRAGSRLSPSARLVRPGTVLAVLWLVVAALADLAPALTHGTKLGTYDLLTQFGLGSVPGAHVYNVVASDQVQQQAPWTALAWQEVHLGHLPLWDPYNGLGLPLAFSFQSAVFSVPTMVGYLLPLRFAYTAVVIVKLILAGTGVLVFSRVLGLGTLAGTLAATIFELSGAFTGWLGWSQDGVFCWLGWILAALVLVMRGRHPVRDTAFLAVVVAFAIFGGFPEGLAILLVTMAVFLIVVLVVRTLNARSATGLTGSTARAIIATACGFALAAPLLLPGWQVVRRSVHNAPRGYVGIPARSAIDVVFSGFYGFPVGNSPYFGASGYYETAAYIGLGALVLAVVAVVRRWREPEVVALAAVAVVLAAFVYRDPVTKLLDHVPFVDLVLWNRALVPLDCVLAVLAGLGLQTILDRGHEQGTRRLLAAAFAVAGVGVLVLGLKAAGATLSPADAAVRLRSFVWPSVAVVTGLLAAGVLALGQRGQVPAAHLGAASARGRRARRTAALLILVPEVAFLFTATPNLWSSSSVAFPVTPAEATFAQLVGNGRVAFGTCPSVSTMPSLGILPEANSAYGVSELSAYNSIVPRSYFTAWEAASGLPAVPHGEIGNFCPSVSSAALAREFGASYILEPPGHPAVPGTVLVATLDGEGLYRVPGGALVTLEPAGASETTDHAVPTSSDDPSSIHLVVDPPQHTILHIHVTDLPGWTATMDGKSLALHPWGGTMLEASLPPGRHTIVLTYWPHAFSDGLLVAGATALALALAGVLGWWRRSRRLAGG